MPTHTTLSGPARSPDTIMLVHGFWVTPRSWEHWITHYEAKGYRVLAPAYPGFEVEVEALNADPTPVERLTVPAIITHLESIVAALDAPPILIGHSAGGAFVQLLLDRGFGAAGVAINSAPTEGILVAPWSQIRSTFPVLKSPANRHRAVALTYEQWRYTFTNTFPEAEARASYARYHVPASGGILWDSVLANFEPGRQATWVDYRNTERPPLLFISGGEDHLMPPVVQHSNAAHYSAETLTEVTCSKGAHTCSRHSAAGRRSPTMRSRGPSGTRCPRPEPATMQRPLFRLQVSPMRLRCRTWPRRRDVSSRAPCVAQQGRMAQGDPIVKIVIIGGTGLIGSKLVNQLRAQGHEAVPASLDTGVNTLTGEGLAQALSGADVVVDVSNSPSFDDAAVLEFFETSTRNILAAEEEAGVRHHVALSVVGTERLPESGYMRAKMAQEKLIRASPIPFSIVHATQFFEFTTRIADAATVGDTVRLPGVLYQPMAAEDVATTVASVAVGSPLNGTLEVGGPEQFRFDELVRRVLAERKDARGVVTDPDARYFGATLSERSLVPEDGARTGRVTLEQWQRQGSGRAELDRPQPTVAGP